VAIAFGGFTADEGKIIAYSPSEISLTAPTVTGSDTVMLLAMSFNTDQDQDPTATYNSVSLGAPDWELYDDYTYTAVWIVVNPASAALFEVTHNTTAGNAAWTLQAWYYTGVDQDTPNRTASTATASSGSPATVDVTNSASGDLITGFFGGDDTAEEDGYTEARIGGGQTYRNYICNSTEESHSAVCDEPGASGTVTHSWAHASSYGWTVTAIPLIPVAGAEEPLTTGNMGDLAGAATRKFVGWRTQTGAI